MDIGIGVGDLHLHTTASDGTCSVEDRIKQAQDRGLDAIAITDHDCISEELTGRVRVRPDLEVITGVEVRGDFQETKVELLGYFVDPLNDNLNSVLASARDHRLNRNREMVDRINDATSLDLDREALTRRVDGMLGRPHLAEAIVEAGLVDSIGEAFEEYLGAGGVAYVPMDRVPVSDVLAAIHDAGGVASLAHPGRIRSSEVPSMVADLAEKGLDAIEVRYPYADAPSEGYSNVTVADAGSLAAEHDLLESGGSDCHGPGSGKFRIGEVRATRSSIGAIRACADNRSTVRSNP